MAAPSSTARAEAFGTDAATGVPADVLASVRREQRARSQVCLWALLTLMVVAAAVEAIVTDRPTLPRGAFGYALVAALVGLALWLNRGHRLRLAWGVVTGALFTTAAVALLRPGGGEVAVALLALFLPPVIAALLLGRAALYATAGATLLAVAGAVATGRAGAGGVPGVPVAPLQFAVVFAIVVAFLDRFALSLHDALARAADREVALRDEIARRAEVAGRLRDEKAFADAVVDSLPGLFWVLDAKGRYVRWNRNLERVAGYDGEELATLRPEQLVQPHEDGTGASLPLDAGTARDAVLVTRDGRRLPYRITDGRFERDGEAYRTGIGIDRAALDTALARIGTLNEELRERLSRTAALHAVDRAITGNVDTGRTLEVVLAQVTERLEVDAAALLLYVPSTQRLVHGASRGFRTGAIESTELRLGEGRAGRVALTREASFLDDAEGIRHAFRDHPRLLDEGFRAHAALPLVAKGRLQGVLELFHRSEAPRSADWHAFLDALATQAAIALDNSALVEDLERSTLELRLAYDTTIEGWARALDLRDHEAAGHSRRVTETTERLAGRLGLGEADVVHVRRGALLHDIGKMGIPDAILRKPGPLTEDEWEVMKRHTTHGHDLLRPIPYLRPAADIPRAHHERWDGSGYPDGLAGDEIPLAARMFAVVDVYDALTSDRPHRRAWGADLALRHVEAGAGRHFDPDVVPVFARMVRDGAWVGV